MGTIREVSNQLFRKVCFDPKWLFLFIVIAQAHLITYLYGSYLVLWLDSFVHTGQIADAKDVEVIFSRMTFFAIPSAVTLIVATGYLADMVKPIFLIAPAFLIRAFACYLFKHVTDPNSHLAYLICIIMISGSIL